ncbi:MAG: gliding motility-associated C-terminal domain-containing protein, partial [Saprospiraceae bacterium]|nr:gliding motility-associated C-terminal domain-containing protein [Saprospiraceae bacterium]
PVQLSVLNPGSFGDFQWEGENLSCNSCAEPVASPDRGSSYLVVGEDPMGCIGAGSITVSTFGLSTPALTANPPGEIAQGATVTLTTEGGGQSYSWTRNGSSIDGNSESITAEVLEENNVFRVEIVNEVGCLISADITVIGVPPSFDIPNAFTPNADDLNDRFRVIIMGAIELLDFKIFNRWGQVVYDDTNEMGWDGRINGDNAPSEVYAYTATLRFPDGRTEEARGEVMLIR